MRSRGRLAVVAGVASLALAGCEGSEGPEDPSGESSERAAGGPPEVGDCWAVPAESVFDEQYWFDTSERVPCTEPHTTETALVARLEEPTVAAAKQLAKGCQTAVVNYVGLDPSENWIPWGWTAFIPTEEQLADGASWVRCEAAFPERWDFTRGRTTTLSASGIARDIPEDFWACLDQPPTEQKSPGTWCTAVTTGSVS